MKTTNGFKNIINPAILLDSIPQFDKDDPGYSASTEDCFNFVTQGSLPQFKTEEKFFRTSTARTVLWADVKKELRYEKEKKIDKLLKEEMKKQDKLYRLQLHKKKFENQFFEEKEKSSESHYQKTDGKVNGVPNDFRERINSKDDLLMKLQEQFRISNKKDSEKSIRTRGEGETLNQESGKKAEVIERKKIINTPVSYSKKFKKCSVETLYGERANTDRGKQRIRYQPVNDELERQAQMKRKFVSDVIESLKSGKSLNFDEYTKAKKVKPIDLYLNLKHQEEELSLKLKFSQLSSRDLLISTNRTGRFEPIDPIKNLPLGLSIGMQTFNEFYLPPIQQNTAKDAELNENTFSKVKENSINFPESLDQELSQERKSQLRDQFNKAVRKVQIVNTAVKNIRELEKLRLSQREEARQAELPQYNQIKSKLENLVATREAQICEDEERRARFIEEAERRKALRLKRELERSKMEYKKQQEELAKVPFKLQDKYSAKKVISGNPYKSYWMMCIDACLQVDNLFCIPKHRQISEAELEETQGQLSPHNKFELDVGYYRVAIKRPLKEEACEADVINTPWICYPLYTYYQLKVETPYCYEFEFDACLSHLESHEIPQPISAGNLDASLSSLHDLSKSVTPRGMNQRKKQKILETFAKMFFNVDGDINREYPILFGQSK